MDETCCNCGLLSPTVDEETGFCRTCMKPDDDEPEKAYVEPDCLSCEDTGYEPGMGLYCTFCKKGFAVAAAQMEAGLSPWAGDT